MQNKSRKHLRQLMDLLAHGSLQISFGRGGVTLKAESAFAIIAAVVVVLLLT